MATIQKAHVKRRIQDNDGYDDSGDKPRQNAKNREAHQRSQQEFRHTAIYAVARRSRVKVQL